jgi:hypothetical protein
MHAQLKSQPTPQRRPSTPPSPGGGLGLFHLPSRISVLFLTALGRFQMGEGPPEVSGAVCSALLLAPVKGSLYSLSGSLMNAADNLGLTTLHHGSARPITQHFRPVVQPPPPLRGMEVGGTFASDGGRPCQASALRGGPTEARMPRCLETR